METLQNLGGLATLVFWAIAFLSAVLFVLLPFIILDMRAELKRQSELLKRVVDELRSTRAASRPQQPHTPVGRH